MSERVYLWDTEPMRLPGTRLEVFPISLGVAGLGTETGEDGGNRLLDAFHEAGGNLIDTAHVYACWVPGGGGASERALGAWIRSRGVRDRVVVSTKGGHPPLDGYSHRTDFLSLESLREDLAESLERLQTDRVDLYYLHRDDGVTPVNDVIDGLNELKGVQSFGASNWSVERVLEANDYARRTGKRGFVALQNQWSLAVPSWKAGPDPSVRFITSADRDRCADTGLVLHAYSAAANGYFDRDDDAAFAGNSDIRKRARELADVLGCTPTQIALAWLLAQPVPVLPLVGTAKIDRLIEALGSLDVAMTAAARDALRA